MHTSTIARITLLVALGVTASGCEVVGGIFKAGMWIGALGVILIAVLIAMAAMKIRR